MRRGEQDTALLLACYGVPLRGEISRVSLTYLVTDGAAGRRISVLAVHRPR